ncbi:MAG: hypothetical protein IJG80_09030 [Selenomonadaceae bacterium]|nr:hypothetical protein [Selenomonadaceae bacterium]
MKDDFLTIPGTNYEINSKLICRNKKTGHILKSYMDKCGARCFNLLVDGKPKSRSAEYWRRFAVDAVTSHTFMPIPSLGGRYEINLTGVVRNARTKKIIKPYPNKWVVQLCMGRGKKNTRAIRNLLWEVHGKIIKRRFQPCPCSAENNTGKFFFENLACCARFLAPKVFYTVDTVRVYLYRRDPAIGEWKITYLKPEYDVKWNSRRLAWEAIYFQRRDKELGL